MWNKQGRFSGWVDIPLNETGRQEARLAGEMLRDQGYSFDMAFTSKLDRAIETCDLILDELRLAEHIDYHQSWKLNERHYGAL